MDELWVMSCQEWPGRPADLEEAAHTTHHEKICPWSTKWQNGHDSLAGQMQIPIRKFKSHCNPMTVGSTYNLAFEICTPPLNLLPSSSLTCPTALPQLPQRRVEAKQLNDSGKAWHCLWLHGINQPLSSLNRLDEYAALLKMVRNGLGKPPWFNLKIIKGILIYQVHRDIITAA